MTIPAWVLGASVNYVGSQGFIPSRPGGSIVVSNTLNVTAISGASVTVAETVVTDGITRSGSFTFTPVVDPSYWGYQYWVDPSNPTESIVGPEGEKYSIQYTEIYDGVDATAMAFHGSTSGQIIYQTNTGLILEEYVQYPDEIISENFHSITSAPASIGSLHRFNAGGNSSDILWQNTDGQAAIWEMNGTGLTGGGAVSPNPGPAWQAIGTGDFYDNSLSDILWQSTSGQVSIWEMNGTNIVGGGPVSPNPGPSWKAIGTGDFNHDGHSDILWQNTSTGQASIWEMNGTALIGGGPVSPNPGPSWKAIGTGDFNADGHSDILWQSTSGQVSIWEMDGNKLIGGGSVSPNPGRAGKP
jgi:FG-GAP-like repeat